MYYIRLFAQTRKLNTKCRHKCRIRLYYIALTQQYDISMFTLPFCLCQLYHHLNILLWLHLLLHSFYDFLSEVCSYSYRQWCHRVIKGRANIVKMEEIELKTNLKLNNVHFLFFICVGNYLNVYECCQSAFWMVITDYLRDF